MKTFSTALVVVVIALSSARGQECAIGSGALSVKTIDPRHLAGVFDLEWQPGPGPWKRTPRRERLWLWPTKPSDSSSARDHRVHAARDTAEYPLFGTTTPRSVSSTHAESLRATVDPIYAPVFLRATGDHSRDDFALEMLVRTVANRDTTVIILDGAGEAVSLTHIGQRGFVGYYGPYGIAFLDSGFACAIRVR